jgi:glycosyltransferase XagB
VHRLRKPETAARLLSTGQQMAAAVLILLAIAVAAAFGPVLLLKVAVALGIGFYIVFVGFKCTLWYAASRSADPRYDLPADDDPDLPRYTILVPLHREANVIGELVKALSGLRYPAEKLQILLLLEADDHETQAAAAAMDLPGCFEVLTAPAAGPRTKPKACNYGYAHATGELVTIFDAEDRPEPDQLLKAVAGFRSVPADGPRVGCLQARLVFWNPRGSWISSFYWAEYVTHFRWALTGMARLGLIPPLGGTSNHFRHDALEAVSAANGRWEFEDRDGNPVTMRGPWDPFNVTEDADLAFRLAMAGYQIGMLGTVTYEEAPEAAAVAKNQRSRWLQGFAQTGLVHTRHPLRMMRSVGPLRYLAFILFMLGTPFSLLLNPLMWAATILYVVARLDALTSVSTFIDSLFPTPVFYAGAVIAVAGNGVLFVQKFITPLRRQQESEAACEEAELALAGYLQQQEYGLTLRLLFTPAWWAFTSISAYRAMRKLLVRSQRSSWDKTPHGHELAKEAELARHVSGTPSTFQVGTGGQDRAGHRAHPRAAGHRAAHRGRPHEPAGRGQALPHGQDPRHQHPQQARPQLQGPAHRLDCPADRNPARLARGMRRGGAGDRERDGGRHVEREDHQHNQHQGKRRAPQVIADEREPDHPGRDDVGP